MELSGCVSIFIIQLISKLRVIQEQIRKTLKHFRKDCLLGILFVRYVRIVDVSLERFSVGEFVRVCVSVLDNEYTKTIIAII